VLQIQNTFCNDKKKSVVQSFTHASACNASQRKSVVISDIATILGLWQHFSGVETGSKFSSGSDLVRIGFVFSFIRLLFVL
jgi:hypothetical protein